MKKSTPYLLLLPAVILLFDLPAAFRGQSLYPLTPISLILAILEWVAIFCLFYSFNYGFRWVRVFAIVTAVIFWTRGIYRFEIGEENLVPFLFTCLVGSIWLMFGIIPSLSRKKETPSKTQ
jgi:hypothetical protein